ncbi:MAG: hypothetical protein QM703_20805 [Gemmatales bacterium]
MSLINTIHALAIVGFTACALHAGDDLVVPETLTKEQKDKLQAFLRGHTTPEHYVPRGAKFVDEKPTAIEEEIKATKDKPIKQYTVQITPHRAVPDSETVNKADVYYYRPNPEKGKQGLTIKYTVDLTTGQPLGEPEVMLKAHTPISRDELAEAVEMAKSESPAYKTLAAGRDPKAVRWEYLQMKVNRKNNGLEPGDRVIRLVFTANANENEPNPAPVRIIVNLTKGTVLADDR